MSVEYLKNIPFKYDLYVSVTSEKNKSLISSKLSNCFNVKN